MEMKPTGRGGARGGLTEMCAVPVPPFGKVTSNRTASAYSLAVTNNPLFFCATLYRCPVMINVITVYPMFTDMTCGTFSFI